MAARASPDKAGLPDDDVIGFGLYPLDAATGFSDADEAEWELLALLLVRLLVVEVRAFPEAPRLLLLPLLDAPNKASRLTALFFFGFEPPNKASLFEAVLRL